MSTDVPPAGPEVCPTCRQLFDFLLREDVKESIAADIAGCVQMAHQQGPWCGVLFTDLSCMPATASRQSYLIDHAHRRGYYLGVNSVNELKETARTHQRHNESAEALSNLDIGLRGSEVAVLFVWKGCIAYHMTHAIPPSDRHFPDDRRRPRLNEAYLREQLLSPKGPRVAKSHQSSPANVVPTAPVVKNSHQHDPLKVVSAPSGAAKPADTTPAVGRRPSKPETFALDPRLVRMVLRVSPELQEDLIGISERLFDETRLEYSYAAILRGLISLGLAAIVGKAALAVEFAGARVPRGRRRGSPWNRRERENE